MAPVFNVRDFFYQQCVWDTVFSNYVLVDF